MNELEDNVALSIGGSASDLFWFSQIGLKYSYSQVASSDATNRQCKITGVTSREHTASKQDFTA